MAHLSQSAASTADDGSTPAEVLQLLVARSRGHACLRDVVPVLARHRLLVPLLEVGGDQLADDGADPCAGAGKAVAAVSVRQPDGTPLALAFTGMPALVQWDPAARPLPVPAPRVAAAVLAEGGRALLLDSGSVHAQRIEGVALTRLAGAEAWPDPWQDPAVRAAVVGELSPVLATGEVQVRLAESIAAPAAGFDAAPSGAASVSGAHDSPGAMGDSPGPTGVPGMTIEVRFQRDLSAPTVNERVAVLARLLSQSPALREVFDGILAVRAAD
jgi:hypothetical protein